MSSEISIQSQATIRQIQRSLQRALADSSFDELRRYLAAADQALYAPASGAAETRLLVRALRTSASDLSHRVDALAESGDANAVLGIEAVLAVHLAIEQNVLLPALAALPGADLTVLTADLQTLLSGAQLDRPGTIDVREIPHGQRHPRIFGRFALLAPGESFTLVNNHDPKPLRREFEATHPGAFTWDYLESGPEQWRISIGRADLPTGSLCVASRGIWLCCNP